MPVKCYISSLGPKKRLLAAPFWATMHKSSLPQMTHAQISSQFLLQLLHPPCHPQEPFQIFSLFLHTLMYRKGLSLDERTPLGVASIAINSIFVGLSAFGLGIRFYSRKIQGLKLSFNDYAALLAWVWTATHFHGTNPLS